jgi:hypothetical protein
MNSPNESRARRQWTPEEDAYLEENFATSFFKEMAAHLNRTLASVQSRCVILNLNKADIRRSNKSDVIEGARGTIYHPRPGVTVHIGRYGKKGSV